jgi:hypothetical protein
MVPSSPDPAPREEAHDRADEALGERLEQHLEALAGGAAAPLSGTPMDPELNQLRPVVARLHQLAASLAEPPAVDLFGSTKDTSDEQKPQDTTLVRLGKYQVVRVLGKGGQATTLLGFDPDLKRHIVIKLYHNLRTPREQEAVLAEGQALARVHSPYVAQCFSAEREDGCPYLVVEYVPGQNLGQRHRSHPLTTAEALEVIRQLAEGLAAVHACGLLHRDIKPGNILLGDDERSRLIDFGLAVPLASDDLQRVSGTLAYMAPEQARGEVERIDARTDLFGLGAVLYELLTAQPLHRAGSRAALLEAAQAGHVVPPRERNPRVPRPVNDLCMRCLARDPSNRFASAAELAAAIRRLQHRSRGPWLLAGAAAVVLLATAAIGYGVWGRHAEPAPSVVSKPTAFALHHPDGRDLRRDFAVRVELLGGEFDPEAGVLVLKVGQLLKLRLEAAQDCHVGVWDVTDSKVIQLFPNDDEPDNKVLAGKPRLIPGEKAIRAKAPGGVEYIHVVASTHPWRPIPGQRMGPFDVFARAEDKKRCLEALRDLDIVDPDQAVTEAIVKLQVRP